MLLGCTLDIIALGAKVGEFIPAVHVGGTNALREMAGELIPPLGGMDEGAIIGLGVVARECILPVACTVDGTNCPGDIAWK